MSVEEDCPVCNASQDAKRSFARAKVAEHLKERAAHDEDHDQWIEEHTENGTVAEIREALKSPQRSGNG